MVISEVDFLKFVIASPMPLPILGSFEAPNKTTMMTRIIINSVTPNPNIFASCIVTLILIVFDKGIKTIGKGFVKTVIRACFNSITELRDPTAEKSA